MAEVVLKVEVPPSLERKFETALEKVVSRFIEELELAVANEILSRSSLM